MEELAKNAMISVLNLQKKFSNKDDTILEDAEIIKKAFDNKNIEINMIMDVLNILYFELNQDLKDEELCTLFLQIVDIILPKYRQMYDILIEMSKIRKFGTEDDRRQLIEKVLNSEDIIEFYAPITAQNLWSSIVQMTLEMHDLELSNLAIKKLETL